MSEYRNLKIYAATSKEGAKPSLESQRMKEGKCKYCGEKWDPKHMCLQRRNPQKLSAREAVEEKKISECEEQSEEDTRA